METPSGKALSQKIKKIEEEINILKAKLLVPHLTKSAEQDYDIKSIIIDKQNEMIELLIKQSEKNTNSK
jgi:hypothetical protein